MVKLGHIATEGTKIQGNASRHKAMSYGYRRQEADRLREDIEALVTQAHQQDVADDAALGSRRGDELPPSWRAVKTAWPRSRRRCDVWKRGRKPTRRPSASGEPRWKRNASGWGPRAAESVQTGGRDARRQSPDQLHRSRVADHADQHKGWEYCGNAQASVDAAYQIIVACDVTTESNDTQQAEPMARMTVAHLEQAGIAMPTDATGAAQKIPATYDSGDHSAAAASAVEQRGFEPYMATGRQRHHASEAEELEPPATVRERMAAKVRTPAGRALYARRKVIVEPVFGQIKEARGRRFLLRGLDNIRGEWHLVV